MRILFVGGSNHLLESGPRGRFEEACREIGQACSEENIEIIVGSDKAITADRFIVEGAARVPRKSSRDPLPIVWVVRPDYGDTPFNEQEFAGKVQFRYKRFRGTWDGGRVPQVLEADAVVLIGGGDGTKTSGQIALALNKPVFVIGYFGGAAEEMREQLTPYYQNSGRARDNLNTLREEWQADNADLVLSSVRELIRRRTFDPRPRMPMGIFFLSLISSLAIWTFLFVHGPVGTHSPLYSYFLMLAIAGALGTILRTSLRLIRDDTAKFSWNQLLLELAAGVLLGFALALLYFVGSITVSGKAEPAAGASDFRRVAVVMTLLGLGGGLALEQASDRVSRWFDEQFRSGSSAKP